MVIVERANADVSIVSAFFERQELLNDQRDIRLVLEFLDDFVGVERHAPNVEIFGDGVGTACLWGRFALGYGVGVKALLSNCPYLISQRVVRPVLIPNSFSL